MVQVKTKSDNLLGIIGNKGLIKSLINFFERGKYLDSILMNANISKEEAKNHTDVSMFVNKIVDEETNLVVSYEPNPDYWNGRKHPLIRKKYSLLERYNIKEHLRIRDHWRRLQLLLNLNNYENSRAGDNGGRNHVRRKVDEFGLPYYYEIIN